MKNENSKLENKLLSDAMEEVLNYKCTGCNDFHQCNMSQRDRCVDYYAEVDKVCAERLDAVEKMPTAIAIETCLDNMKSLLIKKNMKYDNSALEPLGIFSKDDSQNSICIRLDDKLSRIRNSKTLRKNDVADMIGYLTLLCVAKGWTNFEELID